MKRTFLVGHHAFHSWCVIELVNTLRVTALFVVRYM